MRALVLLVLVASTAGFSREQCDQRLGDEVEYYCADDNSSVTITARQNEYVKIKCGPNINCADIPTFDFASGLPLKSVGITYCSPRVLRCLTDVITASSIDVLVLDKLSEPLVKQDVGRLGGVKVLIMERAEAETSIPIDVIRSLPTLKDLRIGGGVFQLPPNVFQWGGTPQLKYLELSKDNLTQLVEGSFNGLESLNELNIWGNDIENITVGAFKGLDSLQVLAVNTNKLRYIQPGTFSNLPNLRSFVMTGNTLEVLPNGLFEGLRMLENITMKINKSPLILDTHTFSQLPSLKNLIIKFTTVQSLPENLFNGTTNLETLDLSHNKIDSTSARVFLHLSSLKRLDLSYNKIVELPKGIFAGLKSLEYLNLDRNFIQTLPDFLLSGPVHLKDIHMDHNNISTISWSAFQGASSLLTLSLANNRISLELETYEGYFDLPSPFQAAVNLKKLNLSGNEIRTIFYDWRLLMTQLEYLDLSWNKFQGFEFTEHDTFNSKKITLDLRHNDIGYVILDPPRTPIAKSDTKPPTTTILLDYNPIACDCSAYGLRLRADGTRYSPKEPSFIIDNAVCNSPHNLEGMLIKNISVNSFICELQEKPDNCTSCIASVATNELIIDCPIMPAVLPDVKSQNISSYFIDEPTINLKLDHQPTILNGNVHTLNISNSKIDKLNFEPTDNLQILDVSNNNLKTIPSKFLQSNILLYLSNNSFECDCWHAEDIAAIQKYAHIADKAQVTCASGDKLAQIDTTALCKTWRATIAALSTFVLLGLIVFTSAILIYRYSNEILVYLTSRGLCRCCISEVLIDKDKDYDLFISFAHPDHEFIQDILLPKLENDFRQKVCVHYRDWLIGDMIPAQIIRSVESSRRTIIILSENFLESMWANLEFKAAHNLALQEGKARVILILLKENVAKHEKLSEELKAYIATNTYLLWGDPKFWEKIYKVLPKVEHKFTMLDFLKQGSGSTDKVGLSGLDVQFNSEGKLINVGNKDKDTDLKIPHDFV